MLSEMPASMAICLGPLLVFTLSTIKGGKSECISCGGLSRWIFHRIVKFLTLSLLRIVSSCCQFVRLGLPPSVGHSAPDIATLPAQRAIKKHRIRMGILLNVSMALVD